MVGNHSNFSCPCGDHPRTKMECSGIASPDEESGIPPYKCCNPLGYCISWPRLFNPTDISARAHSDGNHKGLGNHKSLMAETSGVEMLRQGQGEPVLNPANPFDQQTIKKLIAKRKLEMKAELLEAKNLLKQVKTQRKLAKSMGLPIRPCHTPEGFFDPYAKRPGDDICFKAESSSSESDECKSKCDCTDQIKEAVMEMCGMEYVPPKKSGDTDTESGGSTGSTPSKEEKSVREGMASGRSISDPEIEVDGNLSKGSGTKSGGGRQGTDTSDKLAGIERGKPGGASGSNKSQPTSAASGSNQRSKLTDSGTVWMACPECPDCPDDKGAIMGERVEIKCEQVCLRADKADIRAVKTELRAKRADVRAQKMSLMADDADIKAGNAEVKVCQAEIQAWNADLKAVMVCMKACECEMKVENADLFGHGGVQMVCDNAIAIPHDEYARVRCEYANVQVAECEMIGDRALVKAEGVEVRAKKAALRAEKAECSAQDAEIMAEKCDDSIFTGDHSVMNVSPFGSGGSRGEGFGSRFMEDDGKWKSGSKFSRSSRRKDSKYREYDPDKFDPIGIEHLTDEQKVLFGVPMDKAPAKKKKKHHDRSRRRESSSRSHSTTPYCWDE